MAANPKGTCKTCKKVKEVVKATTNSMRKNVMVYAFFYLLLLELGSIVLRETVTQKAYDLFWFPLLVQFSFFAIFLNLYLFRKLLRFCKRKIFIVGGLTVYYLINFLTVVFPVCNSTYVFYASFTLLISIYFTMLQTIYSNQND
jgi:hypothetical protein